MCEEAAGAKRCTRKLVVVFCNGKAVGSTKKMCAKPVVLAPTRENPTRRVLDLRQLVSVSRERLYMFLLVPAFVHTRCVCCFFYGSLSTRNCTGQFGGK